MICETKRKCRSVGGNISATAAADEVEERFTRRTRGEAKKRFANLKVAFEEEEKVEKDKRIEKIVKKMEEGEKKRRQTQNYVYPGQTDLDRQN